MSLACGIKPAGAGLPVVQLACCTVRGLSTVHSMFLVCPVCARAIAKDAISQVAAPE